METNFVQCFSIIDLDFNKTDEREKYSFSILRDQRSNHTSDNITFEF